MLEDLIIKYLANSISQEEYQKLYAALKASCESRRTFAECKNNWTMTGLILEWKKQKEKVKNR